MQELMSFAARTNLGLLVLRAGVGLIGMFYGAQMLFGVFGGVGLHQTVQFMKLHYDISPVFAILAIVAQFFGGIGMVVGLFTNIAAFGLACTMLTASFEAWRDPALHQQLFSTGTPATAASAFYPPALFFSAFAITLMGGGAYSLDARFFGKKKKKKST